MSLDSLVKVLKKAFEGRGKGQDKVQIVPLANVDTQTPTLGTKTDDGSANSLGIADLSGDIIQRQVFYNGSNISDINESLLDKVVVPTDISQTTPPIVDEFLLERLKHQHIALSKIDIAMLDFSARARNVLRRADIHTLAQLSNCTQNKLLNLPQLGKTTYGEIETKLHAFLIGLLSNTNIEHAKQLTLESGLHLQLLNRNLEEQLSELARKIREIFDNKVPISFIQLMPRLWDDLAYAIGKEPESFTDLERLVKEIHIDYYCLSDSEDMLRFRALKRITERLERALRYTSVDDELAFIIGTLQKRERLILLGRYKIDHSLTLDSIGKQIGVTRERVRQIQQKIKGKLNNRIKNHVFLYSIAALHIMSDVKDDAGVKGWISKVRESGLLRDPSSIETLIAIVRAAQSVELVLPWEFAQSLERPFPQSLPSAGLILTTAHKMCRSCGIVRLHSLTNESISEKDVELTLFKNGFHEVALGWWTILSEESVPERVAAKVISYCGPILPTQMRDAVNRHLSRSQMPSPPSEILAKLLERKGNFTLINGFIQLTGSLEVKPELTGPEKIFLSLALSSGPILTYEEIYHNILDGRFSIGSVTSLLMYSPIVHKIGVSMYSILGAEYGETDLQKAQSRLTRISSNPALKVRSDGVIEFEINVGMWLEYGGVLASGPAAALKGTWELTNSCADSEQLVVNGNFISGLSRVSKGLGVVSGDRIRIDFNTWTRKATINKVVGSGK